MSSVVIAGDTSGTVTIIAPAASGSTVLTLPNLTGTIASDSNLGTILPYATSSTRGGVRMSVTAGSTVTAGSFVIGTYYTILTVGTTSFTTIGAASNTVGVAFIATGAGTGTGTATSVATLNIYTA